VAGAPPGDNQLLPDTLALAAVAAAAVATALHIRAEYGGPRWQVYVCKPLSTTLLLLLAASSLPAHGTRYQLAITVGLAFSLLGDILLMLPRDRFLPGLASFLIAHIAYILAFTTAVPIGASPMLLLPLLVVAAALLRLLWPGLGKLRLPVSVYTATIVLMVWLACALAWQLRTPGTALAAAGALLFMISDALLALNRFQRPYHSAQALIMGSYVAAQAMIALSAGLE
jgi:uncharacterized membrane protein YhhN